MDGPMAKTNMHLQVKALKFGFSEKATQFEKKSLSYF